MKLRVIQHVPFEGPGAIADWAIRRGHAIDYSHLHAREPVPDIGSFDMLVMMGGPMSVTEESIHSWLAPEKQLVRDAIAQRKPILGVCLGSQMIASALGCPIYPAKEKEIGWFPVRRVTTAGLGALLPETFIPMHWHGETFDLPPGAIRLAESQIVPNQAFQVGPNCVGLQFHLEATPETVAALIDGCGHEIGQGNYQQRAEAIADCEHHCRAARLILDRLLDAISDVNPI
jgi:GMP synthase-like glutamine amidotransferase